MFVTFLKKDESFFSRKQKVYPTRIYFVRLSKSRCIEEKFKGTKKHINEIKLFVANVLC